MAHKKIQAIQDNLLRKMQEDFNSLAAPLIKKEMQKLNITRIYDTMGSLLFKVNGKYDDDGYLIPKTDDQRPIKPKYLS